MNNAAALEALLFIHGEAISLKKASEILKLDEESLKAAILELKESFAKDSRGLHLVSEESIENIFKSNWGNKKIQLATKPEFSEILSQFFKGEMSEELSPASLEVASLVAYLGPISRAKIEYVRGVNSVFTLRNLLMRGLIERVQDTKNSNTFLYKPTFDLLNHLGVSSKEELPEFEKFQELMNKEFTQ